MQNIKRRNFLIIKYGVRYWTSSLLLTEDMWLKFLSMHRRKRPLKKDNSLSEQIDCDTDLPY